MNNNKRNSSAVKRKIDENKENVMININDEFRENLVINDKYDYGENFVKKKILKTDICDLSKRDEKLFKKIYIYITPLLAINDYHLEYIHKNKNENTVFTLILNMRNVVCHHILEKENRGNYIQTLFINMVKLYQVFGLDLIEKCSQIRKLWDVISSDDKKFELCEKRSEKKKIENKEINEKVIEDSKIEQIKDHKEFYVYFQQLLHFLQSSGSEIKILSSYVEPSKTAIKFILQYGAPIILWYQNTSSFRKENPNDLLSRICHYTRHKSCHFTKLNENDFKQLIENISVVYLSFGIDLYKNRKHIKDFLINEPIKCKFVNDATIHLKLQDDKDFPREYIISEIKKILSSNNDRDINEYLLFGKMLHYFVSTKLSKCNMITQVFLKNENNIEWCDVDNRFFIKDSENNLNRKSILKLASPFFVWIEVVNKLESTEYNEAFYLSVNYIRQKIINYLIKYEDNENEENDILIKMKSFYKPIEEYFDINETLHNYPENYKYSDIFNKLVEHYVIGRKERTFSYSYIFEYYFGQKKITNVMKYKAKMYDIFNFCGAFYIFVNCFANNSDNIFYEKVKINTDQITDYIIHERKKRLENNIELQKKIIEKMKFIFDEIEDKFDLENRISEQMKFHNIHKHFTNYFLKIVLDKPENNSDLQKKFTDKIKSLFNKIECKTNLKKIIVEMKLEPLEIIDCMIGKIQKTVEDISDLQNEIIYGMKYLFPDCSEFISSDYKNFPEILSQIYSYVVKSRPNVEMSFIDTEEELDEMENK